MSENEQSLPGRPDNWLEMIKPLSETNKERIEELEKRIDDLLDRLSLLETVLEVD